MEKINVDEGCYKRKSPNPIRATSPRHSKLLPIPTTTMTTITKLYSGIGKKNSIKVLAPPGGKSSLVFGKVTVEKTEEKRQAFTFMDFLCRNFLK